MKLPSLQLITSQAWVTLKRFPLSLAAACVAAISAIWLTEISRGGDGQNALEHLLVRVAACAALGIPSFMALAVFAEKSNLVFLKNLLLQLAALVLIVLYFLSLPQDLEKAPEHHLIRYVLLSLSLHLLVAFLPFYQKDRINAFWQYNKTLFIQFITGVLYSAVLYIGITIALLAIDYLLGIKINGETYGQLWFVIVGIFNTWFFLAGVPDDFAMLEQDKDYPIGLKVFCQYILLPLQALYVAILYLYGIKILAEGVWPKGWVGNLVIGFSTTGVFLMLLLHPLREKLATVWVKKVSRLFYILILPLMILLFAALYLRIAEYGFTENRYLLSLAGVWLTCFSVYFALGRGWNIKLVPFTLFVILMASSYGPISAFNIAEKSQMNRLQNILTSQKVLTNNAINTLAAEKMDVKNKKEVSSIVKYLGERHGYAAIQPWFKEDLGTMLQKQGSYASAKAVIGLFGFAFVESWQNSGNDSAYFNFYVSEDKIMPLSLAGYDFLAKFSLYGAETRHLLTDKEKTFEIQSPEKSTQLQILQNSQNVMTLDLLPLLQNSWGKTDHYNSTDPAALTLEQKNSVLSLKIIFTRVSGRADFAKPTNFKINDIDATILLEVH